MYLYFAVSTLFSGLRKHLRVVSLAITFLQTAQMVIGTIVNVLAIYMHSSRKECYIEDSTVYAAVFMYSTYFFLFSNLLHDSWTGQRSRDDHKKAE
jgi:hypothetical protein